MITNFGNTTEAMERKYIARKRKVEEWHEAKNKAIGYSRLKPHSLPFIANGK